MFTVCLLWSEVLKTETDNLLQYLFNWIQYGREVLYALQNKTCSSRYERYLKKCFLKLWYMYLLEASRGRASYKYLDTGFHVEIGNAFKNGSNLRAMFNTLHAG